MKKTIQLLLLLLICSLYAPLKAQDLQRDLSLPYLAAMPKEKQKKPPIVILLHGYGSNEKDLFELKDLFPKNFILLSLRAPMALGGESFQWFNSTAGSQAEDTKNIALSTAKVTKFIPEAVKKYGADQQKVYLIGFSQGAMMSYSIGLLHPELVYAIAPLSGRIFGSVKANMKKSTALNKLRIFIGHGKNDNRVPEKEALSAYQYLKSMGLNASLHTYAGLEHGISDEELKDLMKWINN